MVECTQQYGHRYNEGEHTCQCGGVHRIIEERPEAIRDPVTYRYDVLLPSFLRMMARIGAFGAQKYGDLNWQKSRLAGDKGPVNHIMAHLTAYILREPYDHPEVGTDRKIHLAAIAFNAMMEFWYEEDAERNKKV